MYTFCKSSAVMECLSVHIFSPSHGHILLGVALRPIWWEKAMFGIFTNDFKRIKSLTYMYADFCMKAIKFKRCLSYCIFIRNKKRIVAEHQTLLKRPSFSSYMFLTSPYHVHYTIEVNLIYNTNCLHRCILVYTKLS